MSSPRVAIIADWIYGGGAEKVVLELHHMYPDAPIYTSYCSPEWRQRLNKQVVTGYLQWWPFAKTRKFLPVLRQHWFRHLNLKKFDLVISCTGNGEAKFVRTKPNAKHVCYCFTPPHFYWQKYDQYITNPGMGPFNSIARTGLKLLVKPLRNRDYKAAQRVDAFVSISHHIQADIRTCYGRESTVIFPPVATKKFAQLAHKTPAKTQFITWGRHVPYKRFDLIIAACNELQLPLTVVGAGPETSILKAMAGPTITFTGFATEPQLLKLADQSSAFIFAAQEDFGIAPVEAMAMGLPVLAYRSGGALDYVVPGKTGEFFDAQTVASIKDALTSFKPKHFKTETVRAHAETFNTEQFHKHLSQYIEQES